MSDEWGTDKQLLRELIQASGINPVFDYAASRTTKLLPDGWSENDNSLLRQWKKDGFLNPPNSKLRDFWTHAFHQWKQHRINLIILSPANVISARYFKPVWEYLCKREQVCKAIYPLYVRPKFKSLDGKSSDMWSSRNPYIAVFLYGISDNVQ